MGDDAVTMDGDDGDDDGSGDDGNGDDGWEGCDGDGGGVEAVATRAAYSKASQ